jgi:hypothetical protein
LTKSANEGLCTINNRFATINKLEARSYELRATSFKLRAMRYTLQATKIGIMSYELRDWRYKIVPVPADDSVAQPCTVVWLYYADLHNRLIELN